MHVEFCIPSAMKFVLAELGAQDDVIGSMDLPMPPRKGEMVQLSIGGTARYFEVVSSLYVKTERTREEEGEAICYVRPADPVAIGYCLGE